MGPPELILSLTTGWYTATRRLLILGCPQVL